MYGGSGHNKMRGVPAGVIQGDGKVEQLAGLVYRGMLHSLPASCRSWFGSLRDRGLAALIEVSTEAGMCCRN